MIGEKRRKKRLRRKKFRILLITVTFLYLLFRMVPVLYASNLKTMTVKNDIIEISAKSKGIILKDETVYRSEVQGEVIFYQDEGKRIPKGIKVAQIYSDNKVSQLEDELNQINKTIESLKQTEKNNELFKKDLKKNKEDINVLIEKIQKYIVEGRYKEVKILKEELKKKVDKQKAMSGGKTLLNDSLDNLNEKKEKIQKVIEKLNVNSYSQRTGILSYTIDGLEAIYSVKNISKFTANDYKIIERKIKNLKSQTRVNIGNPIYKIINNYEWYILVKLKNNESIDTLKEGKDVYIEVLKYNERIKAKVTRIIKDKQETLIFFKLNSHLYKFYNERYVDVNIIIDEYEGLKIPKSAIVKRNGIKGVYTRNISDIVKFRPIEIIGESGEYAVVKDGYVDVEINGETERLRTITMFDQVIINGDKVNENQVIN
ncbi:hypothetical protein BET03_00400 [Thermohalobacter berrensis]|uniref:Membrane fusion protein n=2 Tax=Thermohalobacter berrensis TaxID=99594 RepID=A0A419TA47_9FIRM|nr:hypothetical protein BET03_00400 [Thermohalobacter berrensis]